jgi:hypothetical protein
LRISGLRLQLFDLVSDVALSMKIDGQSESTEQRNKRESYSSCCQLKPAFKALNCTPNQVHR